MPKPFVFILFVAILTALTYTIGFLVMDYKKCTSRTVCKATAVFSLCAVVKKPKVTAVLKCAIDILSNKSLSQNSIGL